MKRNFIKLISTIITLFSLVSILGFTTALNNKIPTNVYINGIDVSDMTKDQTLRKLKSDFESRLNNTNILLSYGSSSWKLNCKSIAATYNYAKAIDKAMSIVRKTPPSTDSSVTTNSPITTDSSITTGSSITPVIPKVNITLDLSYNKKSITDFLNKISPKINITPVNAIMITHGKTFTITDGKKGIKLDVDLAFNRIVKAIATNSNSVIKITLPTKIVAPKYTKDNLLDVKDKLGEYTTTFNTSTIDRVTNIKVASNNINNIIVMPNEILSVNKTIGPRLETTGFKLAHVILNDRFVDGIGGGICQVSTTLYNAALLANLKIIERNHHSIPSTYVSVGRDATISGDSKDLKIQNNTKYPIYITNEVKGNHIKFAIYGKNDFPGRKIKITTQILSEKRPTTSYKHDSTLPKGEFKKDILPEPAYTVKSFREVYEKGKLIFKEELYTDKYPLINGVTLVGTKTR